MLAASFIHEMTKTAVELCTRTGLTKPECSCPVCYARMLERIGDGRRLPKIIGSGRKRFPSHLVLLSG